MIPTFAPCCYCETRTPHEPQVPLPPDHDKQVERITRTFTEIHRRRSLGLPIDLDAIRAEISKEES